MTVARAATPRGAGDPAAVPAVVRAVQAFTGDLYRRIAAAPGNVVCSPYSVLTALAMTRNGARGRTGEEMDRVLHAPPLAQLGGGVNALGRIVDSRAGRARRVDGVEEDIVVATANSLWGQQGFEWEPEFLSALARDYDAGMQVVDFERAPEAVRARINAWVGERTRARIPELLKQGTVTPDTRLALVNAMHLKAPWHQPFDPASTRQGAFTRADGTVVQVPMMSGSHVQVGYARGDGWVAVDLPYAGERLAMAIVLPDRGRLRAVERALECRTLALALSRSQRESVDLVLPRWQVRSSVALRDTLAAMGMPTAFSPAADFSGMTRTDQLLIDLVSHEAFIAVDEKGTEAAAATAVLMVPVSLPPRVTIDRTLLYVIHDVATATPLFIGRVDDPSAA
jgi:serpin B